MRNLTVGLIALSTLAAVVPLTLADHQIFNDEFADGVNDWGAQGPASWKVVNGQLGGVLYGNNSADALNESIAFAGLETWKDYRYKAEVMRIGNISTDPYVGLLWRMFDNKGYYLLAIKDGAYAFATPDLAGGHTALVFTGLSWIDADRWNLVEIETKGTKHTWYLNGEEIANITDATSSKGRIGLALGPSAQAVFDNAHVRTLVDRVDTLAPTASISNPTEDPLLGAAPVRGRINVVVTATDPVDGNETGVQFVRLYVDGQGVGFQAGKPSSTYTFSVDVTRFGLGTHRLTAYVVDGAHNSALVGVDLFVVNQCTKLGSLNPVCV